MKLSELARLYDRISAAGSEPQRRKLLADALRRADAQTIRPLAHFTAGEAVLPQFSDRLGAGPGAIRDALARLTGRDPAEIEEEVKRTGDAGEVVAAALRGAGTLTVSELWRRLARAVESDEDRAELVSEVFSRAGAGGAKYFTRMALGQMRIGVGAGTLMRSIAEAFDVTPAAVERLYTLTNDIGLTAAEARKGERALASAGHTLFPPYPY
jgi:DNA ligase-1